MHANVTPASQQYRLREQVEKSKIQHGETARVDIPRVRVTEGVGVEPGATVFFCDVEPLRIRRRIESGDDSPLPDTVTLEGVEFPAAGEYDLKNAIIHSNGDIRIIADSETTVVSRNQGPTSRIARLFSTSVW